MCIHTTNSAISANTSLLRIKLVSERTGLGKSTIWKWVKEGRFPHPYKLSTRVTVWSSEEVNQWIADRIGGVQ